MLNNFTFALNFNSRFKSKILYFRLKWLESCSRIEQKGLRILIWVIRYKGEQPIKHTRRQKSECKIDISYIINIAKYKKVFEQIRKNNYKSSYGSSFGIKPDFTDLTDTEILKTQKFSQIPCAMILNSRTCEILGNVLNFIYL
jgi:hypothetical protein